MYFLCFNEQLKILLNKSLPEKMFFIFWVTLQLKLDVVERLTFSCLGSCLQLLLLHCGYTTFVLLLPSTRKTLSKKDKI